MWVLLLHQKFVLLDKKARLKGCKPQLSKDSLQMIIKERFNIKKIKLV